MKSAYGLILLLLFTSCQKDLFTHLNKRAPGTPEETIDLEQAKTAYAFKKALYATNSIRLEASGIKLAGHRKAIFNFDDFLPVWKKNKPFLFNHHRIVYVNLGGYLKGTSGINTI